VIEAFFCFTFLTDKTLAFASRRARHAHSSATIAAALLYRQLAPARHSNEWPLCTTETGGGDAQLGATIERAPQLVGALVHGGERALKTTWSPVQQAFVHNVNVVIAQRCALRAQSLERGVRDVDARVARPRRRPQ
jgi:hypothetical protein